MSWNELLLKPDASLLGWWPLQDNAANTTIVDSSGHGLTGSLAGGDDTSALATVGPFPLRLNSSLNFDGSADRISVSGVAPPGTASYTVLCRFKCDATTGYPNGSTLFSMGNGSSATNGFRCLVISNLLYFECNDGTLAGRRFPFTSTNWHTAALVIDRSTNKIIGYLDGSTSGSIAQNNANNGSDNVTGNINTSEPFRIGNRVNGVTNIMFDGLLADVSCYNRALTSTEIANWHIGPRAIFNPLLLSSRIQ